MKTRTVFALCITLIIVALTGCNKGSKNIAGTTGGDSQSTAGMILIGKDIITDIIIKPDTLGDPWEVEKVKGFDGKQMFTAIFERIHNKELTVYDCLSGEPLTPEKVTEMEKEFNLDINKIGKIQYLEDWYFNPATSNIVKKIKATSFGYESIRGDGLSMGYRPLFQIKTE